VSRGEFAVGHIPPAGGRQGRPLSPGSGRFRGYHAFGLIRAFNGSDCFFAASGGDLHRPGEEERITKVQNRVFRCRRALLVDIHPVFRIAILVGRVRRWAQLNRAKYHPKESTNVSIRIGLAFFAGAPRNGQAQLRQSGAIQRVAGRVKPDIIRAVRWAGSLSSRAPTTGVTMDDRGSGSPNSVAVTGPITQAILGHALAYALRFTSVEWLHNGRFAGLHFLGLRIRRL